MEAISQQVQACVAVAGGGVGAGGAGAMQSCMLLVGNTWSLLHALPHLDAWMMMQACAHSHSRLDYDAGICTQPLTPGL